MSSKRPLPIYASTSLKAPPPGSYHDNDHVKKHTNVKDDNGDDDDAKMMETDIDEIEPIDTSSMMATTDDVPLVLAPSHQLPIGCRVVTHGLVHAKALNGHLGIVVGYLMDQCCRYQVRPLARAAKKLTKAKYVSIRPSNLKMVPPSTFVATLTVDRNKPSAAASTPKQQRIPLECRAMWSDDPNPQDQQLIVQIRYSDCWGTKQELQRQQPPQPPQQQQQQQSNDNTDGDDIFLDAVNTRIDYEEHVSADQWLDGHEILILSHKRLYGELYDAMLDYEVLEELEDAQVHVGLNGEVPLCLLKFPYDGCSDDSQYYNANNNSNNENENDENGNDENENDENGNDKSGPEEIPTNPMNKDGSNDDKDGATGETASYKRQKGE
jgi:hypothetical protein